MKKFNLSYGTHLLRIAAILCLLLSYLWIAPSQVHALSAGSQGYYALGNEEQTIAPTAVFASAPERTQPRTFELSLVEHLWPTAPLQVDNSWLPVSKGDVPQASGESDPSIPVLQSSTTLTVSIISSPWATLDSNNPSGVDEEVPKVFVVEAVITNTGSTTATNPIVTLDYNEDPVNNWVLLPGEVPNRTVDELAPGADYHAYWFATYATTFGLSHQYTVTADAANASPVATSDNYYGNPEPGKTVKTRSTLSTGNSGVTQVSADIMVGVAFTVTVGYDLGKNPEDAIFSPVGNTDFDPSAYRLLASEVRFYNDAETQQSIVADRLYFPTLPSFAENAEVTFTFIALTPSDTRLCSYTTVGYAQNDKYDQFYCSDDPAHYTVIPITGTLSISLTKQVSNLTIQQNQPLTYTLRYTNTGDLPLSYVWVWDDVDTDIGSIITNTIAPPSDPDETNDSRVAWYPDTVPESGQPGSTGTLTFTILIDGNGQDLADNTDLVNRAFLGINQGSLPLNAALTSTVTTIIQAPTIALSKTDGQATVEPGDALAYTLRITNSGSIAATGLVVTDVLPADVNYTSSTATPPETSRTGQTLVWNNLGPIPPDGGTVVIAIPVTVAPKVPNGTILTNAMTVKYENTAGHVFATKTAMDTTTVQGPVLAITKSDFPDPVLIGRLITYTLHYTNSGPAPATNVLITDVVPLSTTYQSCSGGSACGMSDGVVSWTIGAVPSDTNATVSFSVLVSEALATGTLIRNEDYGIIADQTNFISGPPVTTLVSREAAFIQGYTFVDINGDGQYNAGEGTLSGVTVILPSATVPVTTTDSTGYYRFRVEFQQPISVTAALPAGYFRTTPGTVFTDTVLGITQTVNFGYADTSTFGVIFGTVFDDANHDGIQSGGEKGLSDVTVTSTEAVTSPVTTNQYGQYTLRYEISGMVTVAETNPPLYVSTTPDEVPANAVVGSSGPSPIDFGDFLGIKVTGQVFDDANVNGINDDGAGVSGATVAANGDSFMTGSSGVYTLYVTVSDSNPVLVSETDPPGYLSTNAVPGANMSKVDANTLRIDSTTSGTVYSGGDFGDVQAGAVITISGEVWNDNGAGGGVLANGLRDGTEPGLAGAIVSLSSGLAQTTGSDGLFLLYAPPNQVINVTETNPDGYVSTNAIPGDAASKLNNDELVVNALSGGSTSAGNLFGDVLATQVIMDILVVKEANVTEAKVGETITYTYQVTNMSNVTLDPVTLSDDRLGSITLGSTSLAPDASTSGTASYTVQESDLPGPLTNMATVTGNSLIGFVTDTDSESVTLSGAGGIYLPIIMRNY